MKLLNEEVRHSALICKYQVWHWLRKNVGRFFTLESLKSWHCKRNMKKGHRLKISLCIKASSLPQWALAAYQSFFRWQMQPRLKVNCWFSVNFWQGLLHRWIGVFTGKTQTSQTQLCFLSSVPHQQAPVKNTSGNSYLMRCLVFQQSVVSQSAVT